MKSIQKALIGWKKAGPPKKKHFCFDHVNKLFVKNSPHELFGHLKPIMIF